MTFDSYKVKVIELLDKYSGQLEELIIILKEERETLHSRDIAALEICTTRKQQLLENIARTESERTIVGRQLDELKLTKENLAKNKEYQQLSERNNSLLEKCRKLNETNGAMIDISNQFNKRMLDIMFDTNGNHSIYDAEGKKPAQSSAQTVARI